MKIRVFKKEDGSVVYNTPSKKYQGGHFAPDQSRPIFHETKDSKGKKAKILVGYELREITIDDCKIPAEYELLPFVLVDQEDLPDSNSGTGNYHEMIYFEGDCCRSNLKQDKAWEKCLMPHWLIVQKERARLKRDLDQMLEKPNLDPMEILKTTRKIEKLKAIDPDKDQEQICNIAIEGLSRAEIAKPIIRQKLQEKIAKIQSQKNEK